MKQRVGGDALRRLRRGGSGILVSCALAATVLACSTSPRGWDLSALERRHPELGEVDGHALGWALPHFALGDGGLALFLCRWSVEAPIPVWLPPDASADEKLLLERALAAWEGAGLGVRFQSRTWQGEPPRAGIVFEIVEPPDYEGAAAANTIADCAVPLEVDASGDTPVDAELQYASIHLTRERRDALGRKVALEPAQLMGAAVHEMGHALGFGGHLPGGASVMARHGQIDKARRWARELEAGESLEAPTLVALYRVPAGARVGWLPLTSPQMDPLRAVEATATRLGLRGPWTRVGDESARILWRDDSGDSVAVVVLDWSRGLREPAEIEPRLNRAARVLLETAEQR